MLKFFVFFIACFYFLYVVIDFSTHAQELVGGKSLPIWKIFRYYLFQFVKRADILLPLGVLIGTLKVLFDLNTNREILAFQSVGIRLKQLLTPFLTIGLAAGLFNVALNEYVVPHSLNSIDKFYDAHLRHSFRGKRSEPLHVMHLDDHSKLIYQYYNASKKSFFDAIWIRSPNDIWRMRFLRIDPEHPQGKWVDHLERNQEGFFEKTQSFSNFVFKDLHWEQNFPRKGYIPYENHSMTQLLNLLKSDPLTTSQEKKEMITQLLFKLTMPLLSILVVIAVAPYCTSSSRKTSQFLVYTIALFGFIAFIALMDAAVILGESATVSPYIAILSPFILSMCIFGYKLAKSS